MTNEEMNEDEIHLTDYIHILLQRRRTFLITFGVVLLSVALYTFLSTPVYQAAATLFLSDDKSKAGLFGELMMSEVTPIDSEIQIVQSRTIAEETVRRTHLNWKISGKSEGLSFKIIEFSAPAEEPFLIFQRNPTFTVTLTAPDRYKVLDRKGRLIGEGGSGGLFHAGELNLLLKDLKGKQGDSFEIELLPFNTSVRMLSDKIEVSEQKPKTNILRLSYRNTDPVQARDVVNTMVQVYLERRISFNNEEASKTLDFIGQQFGGIQKELDNSEKRLQEYKSASGVVNLDEEAKSLLEKLTEAEKQKAEATLQKKQAEFALSAMKDASAAGRVYSPSVMKDDPVIAGIASKLADLEVQKSALQAEYTDAHPSVVNLKEQIAEFQRKLATTYETSLRNNEKFEASLDRLIASYEADFHKLPVAERQLAGLMRYTKVNSDIYTLLLQKREEASIAKASTISKLSIIDPAIVPTQPVKPKKLLYIVIGIFAGLMAGVFIAFFQEYLDDTVKDADSAKKKLGVPLLATIPFIQVKKDGGNGQESRKKEKEEVEDAIGHIRETLITHLEPKSPVSEAFRNLRTSVRFSSAIKKVKVIMLTSSFQGEGKSTISANLAITMAQSGSKVLLIDCDLRRPSLHSVFGHSKSPGLTDILAGDMTVEGVVHKLDIPGLDLVTSGALPPNPSELLGSDGMRSLVEGARGRYDVIILDSPPVLPVTDARLLTVVSDLVVLVVEAGRVPRKAIEQVKEMLGQSLNAFVLNEKSKEHFERYYGYYRYYSSKYGGYSRYDHYGYYEETKKEKKGWWKRFFKR